MVLQESVAVTQPIKRPESYLNGRDQPPEVRNFQESVHELFLPLDRGARRFPDTLRQAIWSQGPGQCTRTQRLSPSKQGKKADTYQQTSWSFPKDTRAILLSPVNGQEKLSLGRLGKPSSTKASSRSPNLLNRWHGSLFLVLLWGGMEPKGNRSRDSLCLGGTLLGLKGILHTKSKHEQGSCKVAP